MKITKLYFLSCGRFTSTSGDHQFRERKESWFWLESLVKNQGRSWTFPELSGGLEFGQVEADRLQGGSGCSHGHGSFNTWGRSSHMVSSLRDWEDLLTSSSELDNQRCDAICLWAVSRAKPLGAPRAQLRVTITCWPMRLVFPNIFDSVSLSTACSLYIWYWCSYSPTGLLSILQVECHLHLKQSELLEFCKSKDLVLISYTALGSHSRNAW